MTSLSIDALMTMLVLRPMRAPRNRHFALYSTPEARTARRRAAAVRSVVREIAGAHGPARLVSCEPVDGEHLLRYRVARVALDRTARLSKVDLAVLRVSLARRGTRLLPAPLLATHDDQRVIEALLADVEVAIPAE